MMSTYARNRERILEIARLKYMCRQFEPGGIVVVRLDDVTTEIMAA
jgi:hypothetical protein